MFDRLRAMSAVRRRLDTAFLLAVALVAVALAPDCHAQGAPVTDTSIFGRVFGTEFGVTGPGPVTPLAGATIALRGYEETIRTTTDAFGNFRLEPVPAGRFFIRVDGRTATNPVPETSYYPSFGRACDAIAGRATGIGDVYLPLIPPGTLQPVSETEDVTIGFPPAVLAQFPDLAGVSITVPAGSAGAPGARLGIVPIALDSQSSLLPPGLDVSLVISVQTEGFANPDATAILHLPNVDGLPPGSETALWSLNHETLQLELRGPGTVSADGQFVVPNPGLIVPAGGCHAARTGTEGRGGALLGGGAFPDREMPVVADEAQNLNSLSERCNVYLHSGEEHFQRMDLAIPGRGEIQFQLVRRYRSQVAYDGPLGHNWDFNYNESLDVQPNGDVVRLSGALRVDTWQRQPDGSFSSPAGFFDLLIQKPDGTFVVRSPNGLKRVFAADGRLTAHVDRFGNRLVFDYDSRGNLDLAVDPFGREIDFVFETFVDAQSVERDRLRRIMDFAGREVLYTYDSRGDLVSVRTPGVTGTSIGNDFPTGRTEQYVYTFGYSQPELNHNVVELRLPQEVATGGPPAFVWTYGTNPADPLTFDRVVQRLRGGTNASGVAAGGTETFAYATLNAEAPPGDLELARRKTTHTDRKGNVTESYFNERSSAILVRRLTRGLRANEPVAFETRTFYDDDNQVVRQVLPEGNEVRHVYDQSGPRSAKSNLIEVRRIAGPRGGGEDLVTRFTYEPLFSQVASVTDPRGTATSFVPALGVASAERYTTRFSFDYQESTAAVAEAVQFGIDLASITRGLGDLNGDGRVDQSTGSVVRIAGPHALLEAGSREAARIGSAVQTILTEIRWNDRGQPIASIDPEGNVAEMAYHPEDDPDGDGLRSISAYVPVRAEASGYLAASIADSDLPSPRRLTSEAPTRLETVLGYDRTGNITRVRNPRGIVTTFEVNALNERIRMVRGADVSAAAASGQPPTGETALAFVTRRFYDHNGRVVRSEIENRGSTTPGVGTFVERTFTHDIFDHLVGQTVEVDAETVLVSTFRYDQNENLTLVTKPAGNKIEIVYDERDLPFTSTRGLGTDEASTSRFDYDRNGNPFRLEDAEDNDQDGFRESRLFSYDGFDRVIQVLDALGNRAVAHHDPASNVTRRQVFGHPAGQPGAAAVLLSDVSYASDELNRVFREDATLFLAPGFTTARLVDLRDQNQDGIVTTRQEWDALSRPTFLVEDDGQVSQAIFDGAGRAIAMVDALGNRVERTYDRSSNPTLVRSIELSPEGLVPQQIFATSYVYDQLDRLIRATDNAGQTTRLAYDSRDNLIARSDPAGAPTIDPLGLVAGQINDPGNTTTFTYDGLDRRLAGIADLRLGGEGSGALDTSSPHNPDGQVRLAYAWDANSRLLAITDDNGNRTSYAYDALDRRIRQTNADLTIHATIHTYAYDRDDNLVSATDPNGSTVTRVYDAVHRLVESTIVRGPGVLGTTRETYAYDGLSRLTRATDDNGDASGASTEAFERVYDSLSRLIEERQNGAAVSSVLAGDGKRLALTYPGGRRIDFVHDLIDRETRALDGTAPIAERRWMGPNARSLSIAFGNGTSRTSLNDAGTADIGHDAIAREVRLRHLLPGGAAFVDREYGYNRANHRIFERRLEHDGLTDSFVYDSLYRIRETGYDEEGATGATRRDLALAAYALDGAGNRRDVDLASLSSGFATQIYATNELNEYVAIDSTARVHDDNGNLLDNGDLLLAYDYRNRLVRASRKGTGALIAEYRHDAQNRRLEKRVYDEGTGALVKATRYLYDGWRSIEEQSASGTTETTYVYGAAYVDEVCQMQKTAAAPGGAGTFYLHQNARWDVVALTSSTGAVVETTLYEDFGKPDHASAVGNPYLFQGARFDAETGLYWFRNRSYDPKTGRFLQRDPVWDPANFGNQYTFAGNSPIARIDPSGEIAPLILIGLAIWGGMEVTGWGASSWTGDPSLEIAPSQQLWHAVSGESVFGGSRGFQTKRYCGAERWAEGARGLSAMLAPFLAAAHAPRALLALDAALNFGLGAYDTSQGHTVTGPLQMALGMVGLGGLRGGSSAARLGPDDFGGYAREFRLAAPERRGYGGSVFGLAHPGSGSAAGGATKLLPAARYAPKGFASSQLEAHFAKHAGEWGAGNITQAGYLKRAQSLLGSEVGGDIAGAARANGDILRYNMRTNEFAVGAADGTIRTLFRPQDGMAYWLNQAGP